MISVYDLRLSRGSKCEWCGIREGTQRHHVFFRRNKHKPEYDNERNLCLVCPQCHTYDKRVDGYDFKVWFWQIQCGRYSDMMEWYEGVPSKVSKERFW